MMELGNALDQILDQVLKVSKAMDKAQSQFNKSVTYYNKSVMDDAVTTLRENPQSTIKLFGVKDTNQISLDVVNKLKEQEGFIFHTTDKMAEGGRAIDINLINPLTGKVMTGSSSGSCVNILLGVNDLAIGTDGGGSVLAPAISTGLYSIMGKGLGLKGNTLRKSTDNLEFVPGIGVISHDFRICKKAINALVPRDLGSNEQPLRIAIPKKGSTRLPSGIDMNSLLQRITDNLDNIEVVEIEGELPQERSEAISLLNNLFKEVDLVITAEGPVDLYNLGDSVLGQWGSTGAGEQSNSGKYLVKVANMANATAVTIPTEELATGVLIIAPPGIKEGLRAINFAEKIADLYQRPQLFTRYFIEGYKSSKKGFFES